MWNIAPTAIRFSRCLTLGELRGVYSCSLCTAAVGDVSKHTIHDATHSLRRRTLVHQNKQDISSLQTEKLHLFDYSSWSKERCLLECTHWGRSLLRITFSVIYSLSEQEELPFTPVGFLLEHQKGNKKLSFMWQYKLGMEKPTRFSWPVSASDIQPNFPCSFSAHLFLDKPSGTTVNNPLLSWDSEWKGNMSLSMTERTAEVKMLVRTEFLAYVSFGAWIAPGFSNRGHVLLGHQVSSDCIFQ